MSLRATSPLTLDMKHHTSSDGCGTGPTYQIECTPK